MEFTDPFDAAVVAVAQSAELATPKRTSLPSMLPPGWRLLATESTPRAVILGFPWYSAHTQRARNATKTTVMAASTAHPCRVSPTIAPKV